MQTSVFTHDAPFELASGEVLESLQLTYSTFGTLNAQADNIIWVCHALTANSVVTEWWHGLFGEGAYFDPERHFVICVNMPGSCYGSTHALSVRPSTGAPYYHDFPLITVRDMVRAYELLRAHLGIARIRLVVGGSMGGQQALEWAILQPDLFEFVIPIATNARHSPWGIAFNEAQRMAIAADGSWQERHPKAGLEGMRAARATALLSYRGYSAYQRTQLDETDYKLDDYRAISYQQYQGDKLANRFNAFSYWTLSKAMDSHNVGRDRGGVESALRRVKAKTLAIGLSTDMLFPVAEQRRIAEGVPQGSYHEISSVYGHDGFLVEFDKLGEAICDYLQQHGWAEVGKREPTECTNQGCIT